MLRIAPVASMVSPRWSPPAKLNFFSTLGPKLHSQDEAGALSTLGPKLHLGPHLGAKLHFAAMGLAASKDQNGGLRKVLARLNQDEAGAS